MWTAGGDGGREDWKGMVYLTASICFYFQPFGVLVTTWEVHHIRFQPLILFPQSIFLESWNWARCHNRRLKHDKISGRKTSRGKDTEPTSFHRSLGNDWSGPERGGKGMTWPTNDKWYAFHLPGGSPCPSSVPWLGPLITTPCRL